MKKKKKNYTCTYINKGTPIKMSDIRKKIPNKLIEES